MDLTKPHFQSAENSLHSLVDFELFKNTAQVALDRFFTDKKLYADLFVRKPFHKKDQNLLFPWR